MLSENLKLVYHSLHSEAGGTSPFDATIVDMIKGQDIRIACPYLGLDYLSRMISLTRSWRLLTDAAEWVALYDGTSRDEVVTFILSYRANIRHCPGLHAKVIVAGARALIGSANFTAHGTTRRVEMSVLLDGIDQVNEATIWYDQLWNRVAAVDETELKTYSKKVPPPSRAIQTAALSSPFAGVSSKLVNLKTQVAKKPTTPKKVTHSAFVAPEMSKDSDQRDLACVLACLSTVERKEMRQIVDEANALAKNNGLPKYAADERDKRNTKYDHLRNDTYYNYLNYRHDKKDVIRDNLIVAKSETKPFKWWLAEGPKT